MALALSEGQVSDDKGAATLLSALPQAEVLIADKGYDSDRFRDALRAIGITPYIPGRKGRKQQVRYDAKLYRQRNLIERM